MWGQGTLGPTTGNLEAMESLRKQLNKPEAICNLYLHNGREALPASAHFRTAYRTCSETTGFL